MGNEQKSFVRLSAFLPRILARLQPSQTGQSAATSRSSSNRNFRPATSPALEYPPSAVVGTADEASTSVPESNTASSVESEPLNPAVAAAPQEDFTIQKDAAPASGYRVWLGHPWLTALLVSGITGIGALLWLSRLPPLPNCQRLSPFATDAERLYCADQAARQGEVKPLIAAVKTVSQWPEDHPLALQASHLRDEWSKSILSIANQKLEQGKLKEAVSIARQIPANSAIYSEAQSAIQTWEADWSQGSEIYQEAETALKNQQWEQSAEYLKRLLQLDNDYWRQQVRELNVRTAREQTAWKQFQQAQDLAGLRTPEALGEAIALASKVDPGSYMVEKAKAERETWSKLLLEIAEDSLAWDLQGAIAAAEKIPEDASVHLQAQDIVNFGRAQLLSQEDKFWDYVHAWTLVQPIATDQPLHEQAQAKAAEWEQQIQNETQLQMANWFAQLGQGFSYQLAIDAAEMIQTDQPQRLQAQTLIAQWSKQLDKLEDAHYLANAVQLAAAGTIDKLQAAIAQASQVNLGRALRIEAQTLIAEWQNRLQIVQDQPLLDRAKELAQQGQLSQAIALAQQIPQSRALYSEAQSTIRDWTAQVQRAEDQPILDQARALASQGSLTAAIEQAAQIGPERALYSEAQTAIGQWIAERDAIVAEQQAAEPVSPDVPSPSDTELSPLENNSSPEETLERTNPSDAPSSIPQSPATEEPLVDENFEPIDR